MGPSPKPRHPEDSFLVKAYTVVLDMALPVANEILFKLSVFQDKSLLSVRVRLVA